MKEKKVVVLTMICYLLRQEMHDSQDGDLSRYISIINHKSEVIGDVKR